MEIREQATQRGRLKFEIVSKTAAVTGYSGQDASLVIPETVDGYPVVWIGKKAFLSCKTLRRIQLPKNLAGIGDWAFAYCAGLCSVSLPYRSLEMGQGVFKDCGALSQINDCRGKEENEDVAFLLAATVGTLDAFYLFTPENAGSEN